MVGPPVPSLHKRAKEAADRLLERVSSRPRVAMFLGTGHASITGQLKNKTTLHGPELPDAMALSDSSQLICGELERVPVVVADAPLASYEGLSASELAFRVRVLRALGADLLILTAGAASLSQHLEPGTIAVVEDHLNFSQIHPLHGPNGDEPGPHFPDMSDPYSVTWRKLAREVATEIGLTCLPGVFASVPGPSLPTRAEYRFLRRVGADLVGMSLVPEALAALHTGFDVLALVGITQQVQVELTAPTDLESMLDAAELAAPRMASLLIGVVQKLAT
jgi:purine-nucleoside phosphorylase